MPQLRSGSCCHHGRMRFVLLSFAFAVLCAAEPVAAVVDARIQRFEKQIDTAFAPVRQQLDAWRIKRAKTALNEVGGLLAKAGPRDRVYLAYHLLSVDPKHRAAREVYTALGLTPPFDDSGKRLGEAKAPACDSAEAVVKAVELRYPAFDEVTKAVDLRGSVAAPFWKKLKDENDALRRDLAKIATERVADKAADTIYPLLAYYQPQAAEVQAYYAAIGKPVPRQRTWFNPVDRWLLDRELAGLDPLRVPPPRKGEAPQKPNWGASGSGDFPVSVPGAAIEIMALWRSGSSQVDMHTTAKDFLIWRWTNGTLTFMGGGVKKDFKLDVDLSTTAMPVRLAVRGRQVSVEVGGIEVGTVELTHAVALRRWVATQVTEPRLLRVRYLASVPELDLLGEGPAKPAAPVAAPAAPPAWKGERDKALAATVTCVFADQRLDEVVAALATITGTPFRLAASAEPLADLPVTMTAERVTLRTALDWLQRLAEIEAVPDEAGFTLEWRRSR